MDSWLVVGYKGVWRRAHRTPRRSLFTPHQVSGELGHEVLMSKRRVTEGTFVGTRVRFVDFDVDSDPVLAHRILQSS